MELVTAGGEVLLENQNGIKVLIDSEYLNEASRYRWYAADKGKTRKVFTIINGKEVSYKRLILGIGAPRTMPKNGDPFDLRKENIVSYDTVADFFAAIQKKRKVHNGHRELNTKISMASQGQRTHGKKASEYIGVGIAPTPRKWKAAIKHNGKIYHLGSFDIEADAALAYDKKAIELYGNGARVNFPHLTYDEIAAKLKIIEKENEAIFSKNLSKRHQGRRFENADKTSKYIGVCRNPKSITKPWRATISYQNKQYHVGLFEREDEAARAYDNKAVEFYGDAARLNFPDKRRSVKTVSKRAGACQTRLVMEL